MPFNSGKIAQRPVGILGRASFRRLFAGWVVMRAEMSNATSVLATIDTNGR
jgi:hypothetical protein